MRLYITPQVLNNFNGNIPGVCVKCETHKGMLFHCLWSCLKEQEFWSEVDETLKYVRGDFTYVPKNVRFGTHTNGH